MAATRKQILETAKEWLGTPYLHQASLKGVGCDCIGFIYGLSRELQLTDYDEALVKDPRYKNYSRMPDSAFMRSVLDRWLIPIPVNEAKSGDILFIAWVSDPQHLALKTDIGIAHAHMQVRKVSEHALNDVWKSRIIAAYRFPHIIEEVE